MRLEIGKQNLTEELDYAFRSTVRRVLAENNINDNRQGYIKSIMSSTEKSRQAYKEDLVNMIGNVLRREKNAEQLQKLSEDIRKEIMET